MNILILVLTLVLSVKCSFFESKTVIFQLGESKSGWCFIIQKTEDYVQREVIVKLDTMNVGYFNLEKYQRNAKYKIQIGPGEFIEEKIKLMSTTSMSDGRKVLTFYVPNESEMKYNWDWSRGKRDERVGLIEYRGHLLHMELDKLKY